MPLKSLPKKGGAVEPTAGPDTARGRGAWGRGRAELLALVLLTLAFCSPIFAEPYGFSSGESYRAHDWFIAATHDALTRDTLLGHGQLPARSHLVGGGYPVVGHPSDGSYSPFILPSLLLGEVLGLKLNLVIALLLGGIGVYLLARRSFGLERGGPLLAAVAFVMAGWHPSRVLVGYYESTFYLLFPLMLHLILAAGRSYRHLALGAALTAACVMQVLGGAVVFGLWALLHAARGLRRPGFRLGGRRAVLQMALVLGLAALLGAVKFVPMLDLLRRGTMDRMPGALLAELPDDPAARRAFTRSFYYYLTFRKEALRGHPDFFYTDLGQFGSALLSPVALENRYQRLPSGHLQAQQPEYPYLNVGPAVLLLAGLALPLLLGPLRGLRSSALALLLFTWVCFGYHAPVDLFRPLSYLPVVSAMARPVQYFNFFIVVELCLLAGGALAWLQGKLSGRLSRTALLGAALLALLPTALENAARYGKAFSVPVPPVTRAERFFQVKLENPNLREQSAEGYGNAYTNVLRGVGSIIWDSNIKLPENPRPRYTVDDHGVLALADGYRGEAHLERPDSRLLGLSITPNRIEAEVALARADTLTINQNADPYWHAEGCTLLAEEGLLRLGCPAGKRRVVLSYRPTPVYLGLGLSLLGALALWGLRRRYGRWVQQ